MARPTKFALALITAVALAACDDGAGPAAIALELVEGAGASDTIGAALTQPLAVRAERNGAAAAGLEVRFRSAPGQPPILLGPVGSAATQTQLVVTTDDEGVARAAIRLGERAGTGRVVVEPTDGGSSVEATFAVLAGATTGVRALPHDTAVAIGARWAPRVHAVDRAGNATDDAAEFSATPGLLGRVSGDRVEAVAAGRARIVATSGAFTDTSFVSIVPDARLVVVTSSGSGAVLVNIQLDGTEAQTLEHVSSVSAQPDWHPVDGIVAYEHATGNGRGISTVDVNGNNGSLVNPDAFQIAGWPQYSDDGAWLYFAGRQDPGDAMRVWRGPSNGSTPAEIGPASGLDEILAPDPAADGRVVFESDDSVRLMSAAGVASALTRGHMPIWTAGGSIAFVDAGGIWLIDADGTDRRQLTGAVGLADDCLDSSADGAWLIACTDAGALVVIGAHNGAVLPLPWSDGYDEPAFAPPGVGP